MAIGWGAVAMSAINTELNYIPWNGNIWMSHQWLRDLSQQQGNPMYMSNFRGKSKVVATPLTVALDSADEYNGATNGTYTFNNSISAWPSGGTSPYTYNWVKISGPGTLLNANNQTCTIRITVTKAGGQFSHTLQCTVTDAAGATVTEQTYASYNYDGF